MLRYAESSGRTLRGSRILTTHNNTSRRSLLTTANGNNGTLTRLPMVRSPPGGRLETTRYATTATTATKSQPKQEGEYTFGQDQWENPLKSFEAAADMYGRQGDYNKVIEICEKLRTPTFSVLFSLLKAYLTAGHTGHIPEVMDRMQRLSMEQQGQVSLIPCYVAVLDHYLLQDAYTEVRKVLCKLVEEGMPVTDLNMEVLPRVIGSFLEGGNIHDAFLFLRSFEAVGECTETMYRSFFQNSWEYCEENYFYDFYKKLAQRVRDLHNVELPLPYYEYLSLAATANRNPKEAYEFHMALLDRGGYFDPETTMNVVHCLIQNLTDNPEYLKNTLFRSHLRGVRLDDEEWNRSIHFFWTHGDYHSVVVAYKMMKESLFMVQHPLNYIVLQSAIALAESHPEYHELLPDLLLVNRLEIPQREAGLQQLVDLDLNPESPLNLEPQLDEIYNRFLASDEYSIRIRTIMIDYQLSKGRPDRAIQLLQRTIEVLTLESVSVNLLNQGRFNELQYIEPKSGKPLDWSNPPPNLYQDTLVQLTPEQLKELDPEGLAIFTRMVLNGDSLPSWEDIFQRNRTDSLLETEKDQLPGNMGPIDRTQESVIRHYAEEHPDWTLTEGERTFQPHPEDGYVDIPEDDEYRAGGMLNYAKFLPHFDRALAVDEELGLGILNAPTPAFLKDVEFQETDHLSDGTPRSFEELDDINGEPTREEKLYTRDWYDRHFDGAKDLDQTTETELYTENESDLNSGSESGNLSDGAVNSGSESRNLSDGGLNSGSESGNLSDGGLNLGSESRNLSDGGVNSGSESGNLSDGGVNEQNDIMAEGDHQNSNSESQLDSSPENENASLNPDLEKDDGRDLNNENQSDLSENQSSENPSDLSENQSDYDGSDYLTENGSDSADVPQGYYQQREAQRLDAYRDYIENYPQLEVSTRPEDYLSKEEVPQAYEPVNPLKPLHEITDLFPNPFENELQEGGIPQGTLGKSLTRTLIDLHRKKSVFKTAEEFKNAIGEEEFTRLDKMLPYGLGGMTEITPSHFLDYFKVDYLTRGANADKLLDQYGYRRAIANPNENWPQALYPEAPFFSLNEAGRPSTKLDMDSDTGAVSLTHTLANTDTTEPEDMDSLRRGTISESDEVSLEDLKNAIELGDETKSNPFDMGGKEEFSLFQQHQMNRDFSPRARMNRFSFGFQSESQDGRNNNEGEEQSEPAIRADTLNRRAVRSLTNMFRVYRKQSPGTYDEAVHNYHTFTQIVNNQDTYAKEEYLETSFMWHTVVVHTLAHEGPTRAFEVVRDVLEKTPMANPPSMSVLNTIARAFHSEGAFEKALDMFRSLRVRPNGNTLEMSLRPFLQSKQIDGAMEKFLDFLNEFHAAPSMETAQELVVSLLMQGRTLDAAVVLENCASAGLLLHLQHWNRAYQQFIDAEEYEGAGTMAMDAAMHWRDSALLHKFLGALFDLPVAPESTRYLVGLFEELYVPGGWNYLSPGVLDSYIPQMKKRPELKRFVKHYYRLLDAYEESQMFTEEKRVFKSQIPYQNKYETENETENENENENETETENEEKEEKELADLLNSLEGYESQGVTARTETAELSGTETESSPVVEEQVAPKRSVEDTADLIRKSLGIRSDKNPKQ